MTTLPRVYSSIMARGRGPWSEEARWRFSILGKNLDIWHQLFYHLILVTNGITETAKESGHVRKTHNPLNRKTQEVLKVA